MDDIGCQNLGICQQSRNLHVHVFIQDTQNSLAKCMISMTLLKKRVVLARINFCIISFRHENKQDRDKFSDHGLFYFKTCHILIGSRGLLAQFQLGKLPCSFLLSIKNGVGANTKLLVKANMHTHIERNYCFQVQTTMTLTIMSMLVC